MRVRDLLIEPLKSGNVLLSDLNTDDYVEIERETWDELKESVEVMFDYYKEQE